MVVRPTQSRGGVKGETSSLFLFPLRSPEAAPLVGFGATPQLFFGRSIQKEQPTKVQAAKRPCPKLCASSDAPQSCSFDQLCCVAPNGRDQTAWLPVIAGLFRKQGISRLRARVGGFAVAPDTPSQCTPMRLDFHRCRGNSRLRARVGGFAVAPDTPSQRTPMQLDRYRWLGEPELSPICATILSTCRRA